MSAYLNGIDKTENSSVSPSNTIQPGLHADVDENYLLKRGIWLYFFLLIFEGALRKWFLPGLSNVLLVVRDPIAVWLVYSAWKKNLFPSTIYLSGMVIVGMVSIYLALFVGHGNLIVAIYGARILILHFPLIFVIGRVFSHEDVLKVGKMMLWMSIPMVILIGLQFHSPQSAWVNRGIGGDVNGAGFSGTKDYFRPPGTFAFTVGTSLFFGFLAPFIFYFWVSTYKINRWLLLAASVALIAAIPFSISRTLLFEVVITFVFTIIGLLRRPEYIGKILISIFLGLIVLAFFSQAKFFKAATGAFAERFTSANADEGGLVKGVLGDRFFGGLLGALEKSSKQPFFGKGIGMGTNVGSQLLTGKRLFLIDELEWGRLIGELGPLFGIIVIILRVGLALKLTADCYRNMIKDDILPLLLLSFGFVPLIQGQWASPTVLGFSIMIGGLIVASFRNTEMAS